MNKHSANTHIWPDITHNTRLYFAGGVKSEPECFYIKSNSKLHFERSRKSKVDA